MTRSLSFKINTIIIVVFILCCSIFVFFDYKNKNLAQQDELQQDLQTTAHRLQIALQNPLWEFNSQAIEEIVLAEMEEPNVQAVLVRDASRDAIIFGRGRNEKWELVPLNLPPDSMSTNLSKSVLIANENQTIGDVTIFLTKQFVDRELFSNLRSFILKMAILCVVETLILMLLIQNTILSKISSLKGDLQEIESGNLDNKIKSKHDDELGDLAKGFDQLRVGIKSKIIELNHEIQERKQAEEALSQSETYLRTLINSIPDLVWLKDENGVYLLCNSRFECFFGAKEENIIGKTDYDFVDKELADFFRENDRLAMENGKPSTNEEEISFADDGQLALLETIKTPMYDSQGTLIGVLGVGRDITQRKKAGEEKTKLEVQLQQAQKLEAIGLLAGGVAHDFNNMLGVIQGHAEMAMERTDPAEAIYGNLQEILRAARRSSDTTRQLLAFARKQTITPKVLDLNETVEGMLKMLMRLIGEDIDLVWIPGPGLWSVKIDPSQVDQILANLCINARDAISGVGKITVMTENITLDEYYSATHTDCTPGEYVKITVNDSGCGMDKMTSDHVFEPFFTTKDVGEGTGLGLATVFGAVKQNKGIINVYSEPGQGTCFTIHLPRYQGNIKQKKIALEMAPAAHGHETILLVEDEVTLLSMTMKMLEGLGYTVIAANSPQEAMRLVSECLGEVHMLLTDVIMPGMNGRELANQLHKNSPTMKCLFMSGYTANIITNQGVLSEGVNFIQKPFSRNELATKVRKVLEKMDN